MAIIVCNYYGGTGACVATGLSKGVPGKGLVKAAGIQLQLGVQEC